MRSYPDESGRRLFVGRLNLSTDEATMRHYFERFGALADCIVMRFPDSLRSRGFGFVTFVHPESLEQCLSVSSHWLDDKQLELSRATAKGPGKYGGYGGGSSEASAWGGRGGSGGASKPALSDVEVDRRLFVGRLNFATDDASLRDYFGRWGELEACIVMRWPDTMRSRGFGFVTFKYAQSMEQCLAHAGPHTLDGSEIVMTRARNKAEGTDGGTGGGGGGYGKRKWDDANDGAGDEAAPFDPESKLLRRLFLGRLSFNSTEENVRAYFERFGALAEVVVMKFNDTGKSRGFGFITFERAQSADDCQAARPHELDGKIIDCKRATAKKDAKNPEAMVEVKKLWVGGFTEEISDEDIKEYFGQFGGRVLAVEQVRFPDSGKKRGFGFVEFGDTDAVDKICIIENHRLKGRRLEIKKALSKSEMAAVRAQQQQQQQQQFGNGGPYGNATPYNVGGGGGGGSYGQGGGSSYGSMSWGSGAGGGAAPGSGGGIGAGQSHQQQPMGGGGGGGGGAPNSNMMANMFNGMDMPAMFAMFMSSMMNSMAASGGGPAGFGVGGGGGGNNNVDGSSGGGAAPGSSGGGWGGGYTSSGGTGSGPVRSGLSARDSTNPYARTADGGSTRRGW